MLSIATIKVYEREQNTKEYCDYCIILASIPKMDQQISRVPIAQFTMAVKQLRTTVVPSKQNQF